MKKRLSAVPVRASSPSASATRTGCTGEGGSRTCPSSGSASGGNDTSTSAAFSKVRRTVAAPSSGSRTRSRFSVPSFAPGPGFATTRTSTSSGAAPKRATRSVTVAVEPSSLRHAETSATLSRGAPSAVHRTAAGTTVPSVGGASVRKCTRRPGPASSWAHSRVGPASWSAPRAWKDSSAASPREGSTSGPASTRGTVPLASTVTCVAFSASTRLAASMRTFSSTVRPLASFAERERLPSTTSTRCRARATSPKRTSARKRAAASTASASSSSEASRV